MKDRARSISFGDGGLSSGLLRPTSTQQVADYIRRQIFAGLRTARDAAAGEVA